MAAEFDREQLLTALDDIGAAAIEAGTRVAISPSTGAPPSCWRAISDFGRRMSILRRSASPWPQWLSEVVSRIGLQNGWSDAWFNEAVDAFLSPLAPTPFATS